MIGTVILGIGVALASMAGATTAQTGPVGQWRGFAETMHGPAPLAVTIAGGGSRLSGSYEMELFSQRVTGDLDRVGQDGDSLRFALSIQTDAGRLTFEFAGSLVGDSAGGDFAATMPDGRAGAGSWWLRREAREASAERGTRPSPRSASWAGGSSSKPGDGTGRIAQGDVPQRWRRQGLRPSSRPAASVATTRQRNGALAVRSARNGGAR